MTFKTLSSAIYHGFELCDVRADHYLVRKSTPKGYEMAIVTRTDEGGKF